MRIKRENLSNFAFVLVFAIVLFTPVGFHARVLVSRLFSFSPSALEKDDQFILSDYNWQLSSLKGEPFDFEKLEGKVILLNFWATWCPPCVAEMPSLQELYSDYGKNVAFISVAHDERENVKSYLEEKGYAFPVYLEKSSTPDVLATESIPTTFIINQKGDIVVKKIGAANWNSKSTRELLDVLLKE